jgi:hypothetical protein
LYSKVSDVTRELLAPIQVCLALLERNNECTATTRQPFEVVAVDLSGSVAAATDFEGTTELQRDLTAVFIRLTATG